MKKPFANLALNMETVKFIGGAIIVGAAALIMFPGFLSIALGLLRILVIIVVAGGACLALAHLTQRLTGSAKSRTALHPASKGADLEGQEQDNNHLEVT